MDRASLLSASGLRSTRSELQGRPQWRIAGSTCTERRSPSTLSIRRRARSSVADRYRRRWPGGVARFPAKDRRQRSGGRFGWFVRCRRLLAHVAALALLPLSLAHAMLSGGFVLLAVLAELFPFELGRRQWAGIVLVAVSLAPGERSGDHCDYSVVAMIIFEGRRHRLGSAADLLASHRAGQSTVGGHAWRRRGGSASGFRTWR